VADVGVGDRAPDFELPGTGGKTYRLADYRGGGVILAFYPGDFTRVCTAQFCSYRDQGERLDGLGVPVLGISPQSLDSHERFAREEQLNVPLLADEDMRVAQAYGVRGWATPLGWLGDRKAVSPAGFYTQRAIFLVDGEGIVRHRTVSRTGSTFESVEDLERIVAEQD
jgi:thioredoxin-dependent peroxiredoxin